MKIILKCICGEPLETTSDPYQKHGDVSIIINRCEKCVKKVDENAYHEGLVRGSHLETPLPYDDIVGLQPRKENNETKTT